MPGKRRPRLGTVMAIIHDNLARVACLAAPPQILYALSPSRPEQTAKFTAELGRAGSKRALRARDGLSLCFRRWRR
jgi:hypothetical protein